jgi:hypothetical protein
VTGHLQALHRRQTCVCVLAQLHAMIPNVVTMAASAHALPEQPFRR